MLCTESRDARRKIVRFDHYYTIDNWEMNTHNEFFFRFRAKQQDREQKNRNRKTSLL